MKSLRGQLVFFWMLLFGMCAALAVVMLTLYQSSAGAQSSLPQWINVGSDGAAIGYRGLDQR